MLTEVTGEPLLVFVFDVFSYDFIQERKLKKNQLDISYKKF